MRCRHWRFPFPMRTAEADSRISPVRFLDLRSVASVRCELWNARSETPLVHLRLLRVRIGEVNARLASAIEHGRASDPTLVVEVDRFAVQCVRGIAHMDTMVSLGLVRKLFARAGSTHASRLRHMLRALFWLPESEAAVRTARDRSSTALGINALSSHHSRAAHDASRPLP